MKRSVRLYFGICILCTINNFSLQNPFYGTNSFVGDNTNYLDSKENVENEKGNSDYNKQFIVNEDLLKNDEGKKQIGVVYRHDQPIGILQSYHRSYRFIPIGESSAEDSDEQSSSYINKREVETPQLDDNNYPLILTNFKISSKLEKKRNFDASEYNNKENLEPAVRQLRSPSNKHEKIEDELKSVLDDMGLIEDNEMHGEKREVNEDEEEQNELDDSSFRRKRQKPEPVNEENSQLVENLKDSGDLMISGNKSPLASAVEVNSKNLEGKEIEKPLVHDEADEKFEKRVEKQIQDKIDTLKEQVKREIDSLKSSDYNLEESEDYQRKKRQTSHNLINEETNDVNPVLHPDSELKPLSRKRRQAEDRNNNNRFILQSSDNGKYIIKRKADQYFNDLKKKKNYNRYEESDDGGDLLGGEDEQNHLVSKRHTNRNYNDINAVHVLHRRKRDKGNDRTNLRRNKRQNKFWNRRLRSLALHRFRRRINENHGAIEQPQQLSDMSDIDLFGALPKSYDGELSRYKRV